MRGHGGLSTDTRGRRITWAAFTRPTTRDLVIYESQLELVRLLFADFDRPIDHIYAQPSLLHTAVGSCANLGTTPLPQALATGL